MQLVAYGAQDKDLTGNPQITFFKVVYRRYSNFAVESIEQTHTGSCDFGRRVSCAISRNGDLMSRIYVQATLPEVTQGTGRGTWIENVGHFLIKEAELEIGGQLIDKQYGQWMMIWNELAGKHYGQKGFNRMIGNETDMYDDPEEEIIEFKVHRANFDNTATADHVNKTTDNDMNNFAIKFRGEKYANGDLIKVSKKDLLETIKTKGRLDCKQYVATNGSHTSPKSEILTDLPHPSQVFNVVSGAYASDRASTTTTAGTITLESDLDDYINDANNTRGVRKDHPKTTFPERQITVPLDFWFSKNPGLALPLLALQYHEVKVNVTFEEFDKLWNGVDSDKYLDPSVTAASGRASLDCKFWVDYIYLDNEERTRMASDQHEYLIEQVQYTGEEECDESTNRYKLNFNHPCKEIVWVVHPTDKRLGDFTYDAPNKDGNPVKNAMMSLNGHERFSQREGYYFDCVQPFQHHTRCPEKRGINVYSFALNPEEHQPSGTCNFSRIDNSLLEIKTWKGESGHSTNFYNTAKTHIYCLNYNTVRIMSGLAGLKFSN
jgi:hypothetical protein